MTVSYVGSLSIGAAIPGGLAAAVAGQTGINLALPDIQARLAALASFTPTPPSLAADVQLAQSIVASLQAAISLGVTPPSIDAQLAIVAALVVDLGAAVASINAQLAIVLGFINICATAGIHAYAYSGNADDLGAGMTTELAAGLPGGGPTDPINALVLATSLGGTWTAMQSVFKTTP